MLFSVLFLCPPHVPLNCVGITQSVWQQPFYWVEYLTGSRLGTASWLLSASEKILLNLADVDEFYTFPLASATCSSTFNNFITIFV